MRLHCGVSGWVEYPYIAITPFIQAFQAPAPILSSTLLSKVASNSLSPFRWKSFNGVCDWRMHSSLTLVKKRNYTPDEKFCFEVRWCFFFLFSNPHLKTPHLRKLPWGANDVFFGIMQLTTVQILTPLSFPKILILKISSRLNPDVHWARFEGSIPTQYSTSRILFGETGQKRNFFTVYQYLKNEDITMMQLLPLIILISILILLHYNFFFKIPPKIFLLNA